MEFGGCSGSPASGRRSVHDELADPLGLLSDTRPGGLVPRSETKEKLWEDRDFSDVVLNYINQILMEEDTEGNDCMFQESSAALEATEKSFYDVLCEKYPPSPDRRLSSLFNKNFVSPDENCSAEHYRLLPEKPIGEAKSDEDVWNTERSATSTDSIDLSEMLDRILLSSCGESESALRVAFQSKTNTTSLPSSRIKGSKGGRKKQKDKRDEVDLRSLLMLCAEAIATDNIRGAEEFLNWIRQHSSPTGDGMQRLANAFANGLEARLARSGTCNHTSRVTVFAAPADVFLKAQHVFLAVCPFLKLSNFFANKTIMQVAENATRLHIVDFGIYYGFQWPSFIEQLSFRPGGPPKLRITGIDIPNPGFGPAEKIKETGRRLAEYAKRFDVPFEFHPIAQKWETIRMEDIRIRSDEILVVNSLFRFRNLLDESATLESPRNIVLHLVRKMNPVVFIQGTVNGGYSSPFFFTRFREAMFHYSAIFDVLETTVPREIPERMVMEEWLGREIMNVVACEGSERIERTETYKQWQLRNGRAGFRQVPLNKVIVETAKEWVKSVYHKDFIAETDGQWLIQGWKGRVLNALAAWEPAH